MRLARLLLFVFTITLLPAAPLTADFFIDTWETPQTIDLDGVVNGSAGGTLTGTGIFGVGRDYSISTLNTAISMNAQNTPTRQLQLKVNPKTTPFEGRFQFNYIDSTPVETLTDLGAYGVQLNNIVTNSAWTVRIELKDAADVTSFYQTTLAANTNTTLQVPFSAFSLPINTLGAFREVAFVFTNGAFQMPVVNPQLRVGQLSFQAVPEPTAFALGTLSLAGLFVRRRRQRQPAV